MVWSPPHVLAVMGGLAIGLGIAGEFIRAERLGIIAQATARWGVRAVAATFLLAANFGQLPTALLVFYPERADRTLLFDPTPMTLLILLSGVMPAVMVWAVRAVGVAAFPALMGTTLALWGLQQAFHFAFTGPVAAALGYAFKVSPLLAWPFELTILAVALGPFVVLGPRIDRHPELAGALAGTFYAVAVQVGLILADAPARVNPGDALFSMLLGVVGAYAASQFAGWVRDLPGLILSPKPRTS